MAAILKEQMREMHPQAQQGRSTIGSSKRS
jgi:hypothetical protein